MKAQTVVIGGGIAGLAAANHLAERGHPTTVVEAGTYPAHKVCGEFFSPECLPILERWNLTPPVTLQTARFVHSTGSLTFPLPKAAGSGPRYAFDQSLAERASAQGAEILTGEAVKDLQRNGNTWEITLASKELEAENVIIGTGRLTGQRKPHFPYRGFKAHFEGEVSDLLEMHLLPHAYLGISAVGQGVLNVACLAKTEAPPIAELLPESLRSRQLFDWIEVDAPEFGVRKLPDWENALFVGDAAGTTAPICGDGLAMGITSGVMAAEYILGGKIGAFRQAWLRRYAGRIRLGKRLHRAMLMPPLAPTLMALGTRFPFLISWLFRKTRGL